MTPRKRTWRHPEVRAWSWRNHTRDEWGQPDQVPLPQHGQAHSRSLRRYSKLRPLAISIKSNKQKIQIHKYEKNKTYKWNKFQTYTIQNQNKKLSIWILLSWGIYVYDYLKSNNQSNKWDSLLATCSMTANDLQKCL